MSAGRRGSPPSARTILVVVPPLLAAFASPILALFMAMSASAFRPDQATAFNAALWALVFYSVGYWLLLAAATVFSALGWRLAGLMHALIWAGLVAGAGVLAWAFTSLGA